MPQLTCDGRLIAIARLAVKDVDSQFFFRSPANSRSFAALICTNQYPAERTAEEISLKPNDEQLVESACRGDTDSFRRLYERHYSMAVALAYSQTCDRHSAEDAAQEAFVIACQKLSTLNDGRRFSNWLGTIVRRTALSMIQTRNRSNLAHEALMTRADEVVQQDDHSEVREAIERLPANQREVIYLHYFGKLSYLEIAAALDTSRESVHGRLQRARRKLAKELGKLTNR